jgi:hypothetical protein
MHANQETTRMYAQVVHGGAAPENREQMDSVVTDELLPALEQEPGYAGAVNLVDRDTGHAMMIVLWETEDQARRPLPNYGQSFLRALASIAAISSGNRAPMSVWEVNARA